MEKDLVVIEKVSIKRVLIFFFKAILAGIMIGIGGTIYLSLENKVIGAFLFAIGLYIIVSRELNLYTGKIGYVFDRPPRYIVEVVTTVLGNFVGTFIVGFILKFTRVYTALNNKAVGLCNIKLQDGILSIFILSILCGMLMYLAVDGYKKVQDSLGKNLAVFLGVAVFILAGFEHSIANMYYFSVAGMWSLKAFGYLGIMILGNAVGGTLFPLTYKLIKVLDKKKIK